MKRIKLAILYGLILTSINSRCIGQQIREVENSSKILQFIKLTEAEIHFESLTKRLHGEFKSLNPQMTDDYYEIALNKLQDIQQDSLTNILETAYQGIFSELELQQLNSFYSTEVGKKLAKHQISISDKIRLLAEDLVISNAQNTYNEYQIYCKELFERDNNGCEDLHNGTFIENSINQESIRLIRTDSIQKEIFNGVTYTDKIEWINPCKYRIVEFIQSELAYKVLVINIYEKTKNGYKYVALNEEEAIYVTGEMFREE